jgi:uncharacterized protein with PQ loop repeat
MYFVFFWSSSDPTGLVIAATTAEAEFEFVCDCDGVDAASADADTVRLDLLIVTVVQSWQSGACRSGVVYLFFVDIGILYLSISVYILYSYSFQIIYSNSITDKQTTTITTTTTKMSFAQSVSILAPITNCIQMIPQLYKSYQSQQVHDLSIYSLSLLLLTSVLWLLHGYFIQDTSLIVAGVISVAVNAMLFALFFKYRK